MFNPSKIRGFHEKLPKVENNKKTSKKVGNVKI
jgi:hypothetical protein